MNTIADLIAKEEFFQGLDQANLEFVAGCVAMSVSPPGSDHHRGRARPHLLSAAQRQRRHHLLRAGTGGVIVDTIRAQDVLGWSWLFDPYRWHSTPRPGRTWPRWLRPRSACGPSIMRYPQLGYALVLRFQPASDQVIGPVLGLAPRPFLAPLSRLWGPRRSLLVLGLSGCK